MTEDIRNIRKFINEIPNLSLGQGIARMRELILMMPWLTVSEQLSMLERDYALMLDVLLKGYKDESRPQMYSQMLSRLRVIACNALSDAVTRQVPTFTAAKTKANTVSFDKDCIMDTLQGFVQDIALSLLSSNPSDPSMMASSIINHQSSTPSLSLIRLLKASSMSPHRSSSRAMVLLRNHAAKLLPFRHVWNSCPES